MRYSRRVVAGFLLLGLPAFLAAAQEDSDAKTKMVPDRTGSVSAAGELGPPAASVPDASSAVWRSSCRR